MSSILCNFRDVTENYFEKPKICFSLRGTIVCSGGERDWVDFHVAVIINSPFIQSSTPTPSSLRGGKSSSLLEKWIRSGSEASGPEE